MSGRKGESTPPSPGRVKRLNPVERVLLFETGERVPIGTSSYCKGKNEVCREEPLAISPPAWYSYLR